MARRRLSTVTLLWLALAGCARGGGAEDAGAGVDAGSVACDGPAACKASGVNGVCRAGQCQAGVLCGDDVECGLGERCVSGECAFTGCGSDADCPRGKCRPEAFACTECGTSADCPASRPVCETATGKCLQCHDDAQCPSPGPAYCDGAAGACVYCRTSNQCPPGLTCGVEGNCHGAGAGQSCAAGTTCDQGLMCINIGSTPRCLSPCNLYTPHCSGNEICLKLSFANSNAVVFEQGQPIGVCFPPFNGLKYYRDTCTVSGSTQTCQPNLQCVPDAVAHASCRTYCDPNGNDCASGDRCHPFNGDYQGHRYGLCYPDNGYGDDCSAEAQCKPALSCRARADLLSGMSTGCQFRVGTAPALAPCAGVQGTDGGAVAPDQVCGSGACVADPALPASPFFCYAACAKDADCSVGTRQGVCDARFGFTGDNATANLRGCRPGCESPAGCTEYGPGFTCRPQWQVTATGARRMATCEVAIGAAGLGSGCANDAECASGYCALEDGRGTRRGGYCQHPCRLSADCATGTGLVGTGGDAGTVGARSGPLGCEPVAFANVGPDHVPNTADDTFPVATVCAGGACTLDADCGPLARCVPVPSAADPKHQLVLRCRPTTSGVKSGGEGCNSSAECASGVCAGLQSPAVGSGSVCLEVCDSATACAAGLSCRLGGLRLSTPDGTVQSFSGCAL